MKKVFFLLFILILAQAGLSAQKTGNIAGTVRDANTQETLPGATVLIEGLEIDGAAVGTVTDDAGNYRLTNIPSGSYNLSAVFLGYDPLQKFNVTVTSGNDNFVTFDLREAASSELEEIQVTVSRSISVTTLESPNSVQNLTAEEIRSNPGGNFDISRVVQALPGVGGTAGSVGSFRNDIIIRGGAPNENVYYLDGIEVPVINHFSTQGSAGGPAGILNVSFIEDATLNSSSFHARYDNPLSSVLQFRQREGNPNRFQGNVRLSGTELAATLEGPITKKVSFLASARRSYLQFLFMLIDLPIRPNYWDFQYKVSWKLSPKTTLTAIGLGAIDDFGFAVPKNTSPEKEYLLRSASNINQWNYTTGFSLRHLVNDGFLNIALSRNMFENRLDKFADGRNGDENFRTLRVRSQEIENKLRAEMVQVRNDWKITYGVMAQYVKYNNSTYNQLRPEITDTAGNVLQPELAINFATAIDFFRFGAFAQVSRKFFDRLDVSVGLRTDMNTFSDTGLDPLRTLSPRLALGYQLADRWRINASAGLYYKVPIYPVLGFRDEAGQLVNRANDYTRCIHYVLGAEFQPTPTSRITLEGFYKQYSQYPVSNRDSISLANIGGDFGIIGNEAVSTVGKGRAYGLELFYQQKLTKNLYAVFSYTFFYSQFTGFNTENYIASAWDNRHLVSAIFGYKFKRNWEIGLKYRFQGGVPYTPFDLLESQRNYATIGTGVLDYTRLNSARLAAFQQLDIRVDKKWNFRRFTFDLYLDITNATAAKNPAYPSYTFQRSDDNANWATNDGQALATDGSNAIPIILDNADGTVIPTIGFIVEF